MEYPVSLPLWLLLGYTKSLYVYTVVVTKYQKRISGLLLERININFEVPKMDNERLSDDQCFL